jgi:hypothetical protein
MKKITFQRFLELVQTADYIEIGDTQVDNREFGGETQSIILTTAGEEEGLICESQFSPENFDGSVDEAGNLFVMDDNEYECEIKFYQGVQIKP